MATLASQYEQSRQLLPSAYTEAYKAEALYSKMRGMQRIYAQHILEEDEAVYYAIKSHTRLDVGGWLGHAPVWALALKDSICLFACGQFYIGPKPYVQRIPFAALQESTYNHIVGAVVLAPIEGLPAKGLKMLPAEGYQLLAQIFYKGE